MSLYAYLCVPTYDAGSRHFSSPIVEWIDVHVTGRPQTGCRMLWPPLSGGPKTRHQVVLCLVRNITTTEAGSIANLDGVHALGEVDRTVAFSDTGRAKQVLDTFEVPLETRTVDTVPKLVNRLNRWLVPERKLVVAE